jgi:rfaE bifunctional protein kinase chain/domain
MTPQEILATFPGKHVVVIGDVMLDEFVHGDVSRISPEAPVPVIEVRERVRTPGGAANAAANVVSLGGRATLLGVIGDDAAGGALIDAITARGIDATHLTVDDSRPTTQKSRIIARGQQIVRMDAESRAALSAEIEAALIATIRAMHADAVIVSDYAKGAVTEAVAQAAIRTLKVPVVVDPKGRDFRKYRGATVITPNTSELEAASGKSAHEADDIVRVGSELLPLLEGGALLVTRGPQGMTLLEPSQPPYHLPTMARAVFDVTGAGDTVVGTLALGLTAGARLRDVLELASRAAGVVVGKAGTATVTPDELY